jgi:hypothetical protein
VLQQDHAIQLAIIAGFGPHLRYDPNTRLHHFLVPRGATLADLWERSA